MEFGPLRSKAARKPWPECPDIVMYRCRHCSRLYQVMGYDMPIQEPVCCGVSMECLKALPMDAVLPEINIDYKIVGGFNQNAVQIFWEIKQLENRPEWILLKTFTGAYIKYVSAKKQPPMVFPLADEDAYVYCDRSKCLECVFRCKRGFIMYLYIKTKGLLELPLDKMSAYFNT